MVGASRYRGIARCQWAALCFLLVLGAGCSGSREQARKQSEASLKLGRVYISENRLASALQEFAKAQKLAPDNVEVMNAAGYTYMLRREYGLAEAQLRKAIDLKPDYSEAWNHLGVLYMLQERYAEAIPAFEETLKNVYYETPERPLANLGRALFEVGRIDEAESRLRQALDAAPDFPIAQLNLAAVLQTKGNHQEALKLLEGAVKGLPDSPEAHRLKGMSQFRLGDREGARVEFERAWRLSPESEDGKSAKTYLDMLQ